MGGTPFRDPFGSLKIGAPLYFGPPVLAVVKEKESVGKGATGLFFCSEEIRPLVTRRRRPFLGGSLPKSHPRTYQCLMYRTVWAFVPLGLPTA